MKHSIIPFLLICCFALATVTGCNKHSYPCPSYATEKNTDVTLKKDENGFPIEGRHVKKDKNGLVTKKKDKRLRKDSHR